MAQARWSGWWASALGATPKIPAKRARAALSSRSREYLEPLRERWIDRRGCVCREMACKCSSIRSCPMPTADQLEISLAPSRRPNSTPGSYIPVGTIGSCGFPPLLLAFVAAGASAFFNPAGYGRRRFPDVARSGLASCPDLEACMAGSAGGSLSLLLGSGMPAAAPAVRKLAEKFGSLVTDNAPR